MTIVERRFKDLLRRIPTSVYLVTMITHANVSLRSFQFYSRDPFTEGEQFRVNYTDFEVAACQKRFMEGREIMATNFYTKNNLGKLLDEIAGKG